MLVVRGCGVVGKVVLCAGGAWLWCGGEGVCGVCVLCVMVFCCDVLCCCGGVVWWCCVVVLCFVVVCGMVASAVLSFVCVGERENTN